MVKVASLNYFQSIQVQTIFVTKLMLQIKFVYVCTLQKVSLWKKIHVIYSFFFVRKVIAHINTFVFYCIVLPATVLVPEVAVPKWGAVYIPSVITLLNAVGTPRSLILSIFLLQSKTLCDMLY
jgi:hypothetical protein